MQIIKRKLSNWVLKHLLNAITVEDIVTHSFKANSVYVNGKQLTKEEVESIKEEVKMIEATRFWSLTQGTLNATAKDKIFNLSTNYEDIYFGKAMLYNLDVQNKLINIFKNIK